MIETIPNPLTDKGVQEDIEKKTDELMFRSASMRLCDVSETMRKVIKKAAQWGMSEGFRMGWKIHEGRSKISAAEKEDMSKYQSPDRACDYVTLNDMKG